MLMRPVLNKSYPIWQSITFKILASGQKNVKLEVLRRIALREHFRHASNLRKQRVISLGRGRAKNAQHFYLKIINKKNMGDFLLRYFIEFDIGQSFLIIQGEYYSLTLLTKASSFYVERVLVLESSIASALATTSAVASDCFVGFTATVKK